MNVLYSGPEHILIREETSENCPYDVDLRASKNENWDSHLASLFCQQHDI
jgi:hypothetical protein